MRPRMVQEDHEGIGMVGIPADAIFYCKGFLERRMACEAINMRATNTIWGIYGEDCFIIGTAGNIDLSSL